MTKRKKIMWTSGLLCIAFLVGLYIFQLHALTALAYHIAETQEKFAKLKHENATLQSKAHQTLSLKNLAELAAQQNFEKVTSIVYVRQIAGGVAQNQ